MDGGVWRDAVCGLLITMVTCIAVSAVSHTPLCTSDVQFAGAQESTFDTVGNKTVWGVCNYPNPRDNYEMCGRRNESWVCDPDHLLSAQQADALENLLVDSYKKTFCRCKERCTDQSMGHPMVVLLLDELRVPDLTDSVCSGGACGELYPQINPTGRAPSVGEQERAVQTFSSGILRCWQLGLCSDGVVIVYWARHKWLSVAAGELAQDLLRDIIESAQTRALIDIEGRSVSEGLSGLVTEYTSALHHQKLWPFYLGVTLAAIAGCLLVFGIIMTIVFCRKEFQQGKSCSQVLHSCIGGENAVLLGGNRPRLVPAVYEQTKTSEPVA